MNLRSLTPRLLHLAFVLGGIISLICFLVVIVSFIRPDVVNQVELGSGSLRDGLAGRTHSLESYVGIRPLFDTALLIGSYVLVSLLLWSQQRIGTYFAHRRNF